MQILRYAATSGDVRAVRTLLNRPAVSVAGFINGTDEVSETLALQPLLLLLLLLLLFVSPFELFP
jgi:hypothetical protein